MRAVFLTITLLAWGCAAGHLPPVTAYNAGDRDDALTRQAELAATPGKDQNLERLRLASMALATGDDERAELALRAAAASMTNFQADGEFRAVVGAEEAKEWKGEPYEKMAAFLTLGALLYGDGDRGNALAMFKSAILADTGTAEERYRSDFVPAWVLASLAFAAEREDSNAAQYMDRAIDALWSRTTVSLLSDALVKVRVEGDQTGVTEARAVLLAALAGGVTAAPRDPDAAVRATVSWATDLLKIERDKPKRDRALALQGFSIGDFREASDAMSAVSAAWAAAVAALPPAALDEPRARQAGLEALLTDPPDVVLLVERGDGPMKIRTGRYGEILQIVPGRRAMTAPTARLDGEPLDPLWMDSLSWQATTRGGRKVDGFLEGKAVFKDSSLVTGYVLLRVAEAAAASDETELATILACAGCLLTVAGAATNPAADIRHWDLLPDGWYLVVAHAAPGEHRLELDGRPFTLRVPAAGQLVGVVPVTAPGGADTLGAE